MATRTTPRAQGLKTPSRIDDPGRFRIEPLPAGATGQAVQLSPARAQALLQRSAAEAAGLVDDAARQAGVLWRGPAGELLVRPALLRLQLRDGLIALSLPVSCDQTGEALVHLTFAVGSTQRPAGLLASTEDRPRGPGALVAAWGDNLLALAWQALLNLLQDLAAESGRDQDGAPLLPVAMVASAKGLVVQVAARHAFDRLIARG